MPIQSLGYMKASTSETHDTCTLGFVHASEIWFKEVLHEKSMNPVFPFLLCVFTYMYIIYIYTIHIYISEERAQSLTDFNSGSKDRNGKGTEGGREALLSFKKPITWLQIGLVCQNSRANIYITEYSYTNHFSYTGICPTHT